MDERYYNFFLNFHFEGLDDYLTYRVNKKTYDRVRRNLNEADNDFCWLSTLEGREVAISLNHIEFVHFLWEPKEGRIIMEDENSSEKKYAIYIHFQSKKTPFICGSDEAEEVYDLFHNLEMGIFPDEPWLSFEDEDGEEIVFDARKILYVEAPSDLVNEGMKILEDEMKEASKKQKPKKTSNSSKNNSARKKDENDRRKQKDERLHISPKIIPLFK
jgi:hypothetical protein